MEIQKSQTEGFHVIAIVLVAQLSGPNIKHKGKSATESLDDKWII